MRVHPTIADCCKPVAAAVLALALEHGPAIASFTTFHGGLEAEAEWRAAAGTYAFESFESFADGQQIQALPALGVQFDPLAGGGYPQAYWFGGGTPHGVMHLGNFPNGINETNRWNDIVMRPMPGLYIFALGYWNGDGQRDTLGATAYADDGSLVGEVGSFTGTFGGFVSQVPVARVVFGGLTGDGWNHLDGLQTAVAVPEPEAWALFSLGVVALAGWTRRRSHSTWPSILHKATPD